MVSHTITIHEQAKRDLGSLPQSDQDRITTILGEVSEGKQPTAHPKCEWLDGQDLLKVRVGTYRVLIDLDKRNRELRIVHLGERKNVYDGLSVATHRAQG